MTVSCSLPVCISKMLGYAGGGFDRIVLRSLACQRTIWCVSVSSSSYPTSSSVAWGFLTSFSVEVSLDGLVLASAFGKNVVSISDLSSLVSLVSLLIDTVSSIPFGLS